MTVVVKPKSMLFSWIKDKKNKVEIYRQPENDSIVVELHLDTEKVPFFATIRKRKSYVSTNGFAQIYATPSLEFYSHLFATAQVPDYEVIFAYDNDLYCIPAKKITETGNHKYLIGVGEINERTFLKMDWIQQFKMFSNNVTCEC